MITQVIYCDNFFKLNTTLNNYYSDDNDEIIQPRIWSEVFENWIVTQNNYNTNHREAKVIKYNDKVVNILQQGTMTNNKREVSETDLYLLGAIEKLVYRVETLEQRLRRSEELLYYLISGNTTLQDPCPKNYTKIGKQCYHFGGREYDWKSSASLCRSVGGDLIEFENVEETEKIKSYLKGETNIKNRDFWTGGLNPGLLWIWASSAKPVYEDETHNINGNGRCLKFRYSLASKAYFFEGEECVKKLNYICKHSKKNSADKVKAIQRSINNT